MVILARQLLQARRSAGNGESFQYCLSLIEFGPPHKMHLRAPFADGSINEDQYGFHRTLPKTRCRFYFVCVTSSPSMGKDIKTKKAIPMTQLSHFFCG